MNVTMKSGMHGIGGAVVAVLCLWAAAASEPQRLVDISASRLGMGLVGFTQKSTYNSYDFARSPLGILETDTVPVRLDLAYRLLRWHEITDRDSLQHTYMSAVVPRLTVGKPKTVYLSLDFMPHKIEFHDYTLPVKRFSLTIAGGVPSGIFRIAFAGEGYFGKLKRSGNDNRRALLGVESAGLWLGSQVHRLVRLGFHAAGSGLVDTLYTSDGYPADRYFLGRIPRIGGDVDFGAEGFPVLSNFTIDWAARRFIYVSKLSEAGELDYGPIMYDTLGWDWQTMAEVTMADLLVQPAVNVGFWRTNAAVHERTGGNDDPFDYGAKVDGRTWRLGALHIGAGGQVSFRGILAAGLEYTYRNLSLHYGDAWPSRSTRTRHYHRTALGVACFLHQIPVVHFPQSYEMRVRLGYANALENSGIDAYGAAQLAGVDSMSVGSGQWRYEPDFGFGPDQRISRFSVGLGNSFLSGLVAADAYIAFLRRTGEIDFRGFEFGADMRYELRNVE